MEDAAPVVDEWLLLHSMLLTAMMKAETKSDVGSVRQRDVDPTGLPIVICLVLVAVSSFATTPGISTSYSLCMRSNFCELLGLFSSLIDDGL